MPAFIKAFFSLATIILLELVSLFTNENLDWLAIRVVTKAHEIGYNFVGFESQHKFAFTEFSPCRE